MWSLLLTLVIVPPAVAGIDGAVVRKDDAVPNSRSFNGAAVVLHDGVTADLAVVRRHDGQEYENVTDIVNESHFSVRKELTAPLRANVSNWTRKAVALEVDADANVVRWEAATGYTDASAKHQDVEVAVRDSQHEVQQPLSGQLERHEAPEQRAPSSMLSTGLTQLSYHALTSKQKLRRALAQLQQRLSGKMSSSVTDALTVIETALVVILAVLIGLFTLSAVTVAYSRYRERSRFSQTQATAMMRVISAGGNYNNANSRSRSPSPMGHSISQREGVLGRRQSAGGASPPPFASVRAGSARRASAQR